MSTYELAADEVVLCENDVFRKDLNENLKLTLTTKKIVFEKNKVVKTGFLKTKNEKEVADIIMLDTIKKYNEKPQVSQKGLKAYVQTTNGNLNIEFHNLIEVAVFVNKVIEAITGATLSDRSFNQVKNTFNKVDDALGFNTRETIKGVVENGVIGMLRGTKRNKNKN